MDFIFNHIGIILLIVCFVILITFPIAIYSAFKISDNQFKDKYGSNYQSAIANLDGDIECKPYPAALKLHLYCPDIEFPDFKVIKCISHSRTRDANETVYIEFYQLPDQSYFKTSNHTYTIYGEEEGSRYLVFEYRNSADLVSWSIVIQEGSCKGIIRYMTT